MDILERLENRNNQTWLNIRLEVAAEIRSLREKICCPKGECADRTQCWEPCGDLGHDEDHAERFIEDVPLRGRDAP